MIKQKLLTKNEWSRPDRELGRVKAIVLHWLADPKGTPESVYNWFESRKKGTHGYGSAHYCVGVDGRILQYIPDEEMAYHVGSKTYTDYALFKLGKYPNNYTIGIEMCHMNWEGEFSDETWIGTKELVALLLREHRLTEADITTHMEVVGWKDCPRWFKTFPTELTRFKEEVGKLLEDRIRGRVTVGSLNVRNEPKGKQVVDTIKKGDTVELIGVQNGWYKVLFDNTVGYCSSKYMELV